MANGETRNTGQSVGSVAEGTYTQQQIFTRSRTEVRGLSPSAKQEEIATLVVRDLIYEDWETVWVQASAKDPWQQFRFTAVEDDTNLWTSGAPLLRFKPGDEVDIYLGGYLVLHGVILIRQVSYDAKNHGIVLQGVTLTYYAANASIISEDAQYEGSFEEIAAQVLAPTCSGYKTMGELDQTPFKPPVHANQGQAIWDFLEPLARDRKIIMTSTPYGDFLFVGEHDGEYVGDLVEGGNILKCNAIIADLKARSDFISSGQSSGSDQKNGAESAHMRASIPGTAKCYNPLLTPIEHPVWTQHEVELRAANEKMYAEGQGKVEATVVVQGWFNPKTGKRWDIYDVVRFESPMTGIDDQEMVIETVTYTQDRNGTLTTMKIVAPWGFNDRRHTRGGGPLGTATSDNGPATTPPTQTPHSQR